MDVILRWRRGTQAKRKIRGTLHLLLSSSLLSWPGQNECKDTPLARVTNDRRVKYPAAESPRLVLETERRNANADDRPFDDAARSLCYAGFWFDNIRPIE